jgi:hypothetical protein
MHIFFGFKLNITGRNMYVFLMLLSNLNLMFLADESQIKVNVSTGIFPKMDKNYICSQIYAHGSARSI